MDKTTTHKGIERSTEAITDFVNACRIDIEKLKIDHYNEDVFYTWDDEYTSPILLPDKVGDGLKEWIEYRKEDIASLAKKADLALLNFDIYFEAEDMSFEESLTTEAGIRDTEIQRSASYLRFVELNELHKIDSELDQLFKLAFPSEKGIKHVTQTESEVEFANNNRQRQPGWKFR